MPNWGLTPQQRAQEPWDIPARLLAPSKTLTDPVHGDVYLTELEARIVDSVPMQRLRRVRQLGTTHLVYDGATHSRLSHALGTLRVAQDLLDAVWNSRSNPQSKGFPRSQLAVWEERKCLETEFGRATVLARLGALLHDVCHVPMGHTIEDDLKVLDPHDGNMARFEKLWQQMPAKVKAAVTGDLYRELVPLIVSKDSVSGAAERSQYPFVGDIVGNTICADLIDYLQRDHRNCGLPIALGKRFMDSFFVADENHPLYPLHMVIGIERDGRLRNDIVSELLKYLRYRYELTERVLTHHAKVAADAMLSKVLEDWSDERRIQIARRLLRELPADATEEEVRASASKQLSDQELNSAVKQEVEGFFLAGSDDGILQQIANEATDGSSPRLRRASETARALLNRKLFKSVGIANGDVNRAIAEPVYEMFGSNPAALRALESEAAVFAGLGPDERLALWLPSPAMRLKVAEVLVYRDRSIAPLSKVERASQEIVEMHQKLWAVTVFASSHLRKNRKASDAVLAFLSDRTGLSFHRRDGSPVPGTFELAVNSLLEKDHPSYETRRQLMDLRSSVEYELVAATASGANTLSTLIEAVKQAAIEEEILKP